MIGFICKIKKNVDFIKNFVFDLVMVRNQIMPCSFHNLVILLARIWPEALNWPMFFDESINLDLAEDMDILARKNPVLLVIIYIVKNHLKKINVNNPKRNNDSLNQSEYMAYVNKMHLILFLYNIIIFVNLRL